MGFNEKLQQLRTRKNLAQEQFVEQLYMSRTAVSKWESGKGYPNIESFKYISKFFSVTIDELLSGEELITLAEAKNRPSLKETYSYTYGILDIVAVAFIFLPLYEDSIGGYVCAVNLLSFTVTTPFNLAVYWSTFATSVIIGIAKTILTHLDKKIWGDAAAKCSLGLTVLAIRFLTAAREPYIIALMFPLFIVKVVVWIKQNGTK